MRRRVHKKVYCINSECSKRNMCGVYVDSPRIDGDNKKFEEKWGGVDCYKYRPNNACVCPKPSDAVAVTGNKAPIAFFSSIPQEMELREYLVRHVGDNLDKVFCEDQSWQKHTHNYSLVSSRIIDLIMPIIVSKKGATRR